MDVCRNIVMQTDHNALLVPESIKQCMCPLLCFTIHNNNVQLLPSVATSVSFSLQEYIHYDPQH